MKPEMIHEALQSLDDELIEETDRIRSQQRAIRWGRWAALAAAVMIAFAGIGVWAALGDHPFAVTKDAAESAPEQAPSYEEDDNGVAEQPAETLPNNAQDDRSDTVENRSEEETVQPENTMAVTVRLVARQEDGFTAVIVDNGGDERLEDVEDAVVYTNDAADWAPDTLLLVRFDKAEIQRETQIGGATLAVFYAVEIEPVENGG